MRHHMSFGVVRRRLLGLLAPLLMATAVVGAWSAPAFAYNALVCDRSGPQPVDTALAGTLNPQLNGKMRGALSGYNMSCARIVVQTVLGRGLPVRAAELAVTTIITETSMANLDGGDGSSVGLFQQINSWGSFSQRTDPVWATNAFLDHLLRVSSWQTRPIGEVCQAVQVSGYPDRYATQAHDGVLIADAIWTELGKPAAQVVLTGTDNALYHEVRYPWGSWSGLASLNGFAKQVDVAVLPDGTSQVAVIGADDGLYHEGRHVSGAWTGFQPVPGAVKAKGVSIAALPDRTTQIAAIGRDDDVVYWAGRSAAGAWTSFTPIPGAVKAKAVAIAGLPDRTAQVLIIGKDDDVVYWAGRLPDGQWTAFKALAGAGTTTPAKAKRVSITGLPDSTSQVLIIGLNDDVVYHQGRYANDTWTGFKPLTGAGTTTPAKAKRVSIAGQPDSTAQVLITGYNDDVVYHQLRNPNGTWTGFRALNGAGTTTPAKANDIAIS
jgi:hypothetical protein